MDHDYSQQIYLTSFAEMLDRFVPKYVNDDLQWFIDNHLEDLYQRRRDALQTAKKDNEMQIDLLPAIDYLLKTVISTEQKYPPKTVSQWHDYYEKLGFGNSHNFQHLLLVYMKLDLANYLSVRDRESTAGRQTRIKDKTELNLLQASLGKLTNIPRNFDFSLSVIKLATGLWAFDNNDTNLMVSCLSDPLINFNKFFEKPDDLVQIIVGTLFATGDPGTALYMNEIHKCDNWDENYNQMHADLLIRSGQLAEALNYERMFMDQKDYSGILTQFFELCSSNEIAIALNRLNLSIEEEEAFNRYQTATESRPVTPVAPAMLNQTRNSHLFTPPHPSYRVHNTSNHGSANRHTPKHTPRNRNVQALRKVPSFSDSPARNTRSARKRKSDK